MSEKILRTPQALEHELAVAVRDLLRNNLTIHGLAHSKDLTAQDLVINIHMAERLSTALAAENALKGYQIEHIGYKVVPP
jgi:hypothetical protein